MFKKQLGVSLLFLFINALAGYAQEIKPSGKFLEDSISIGRSFPYTLSVRYPKNVDIVFPDSLFDFSPYELEDKIYYPTRSDETHSFDSAVYYLTSFEIDTVQYLSLPVYIIESGDSIELLPAKDSVFLKQVVTEIPDSVATEAMPLKENTTYKRVDFQFNYPYFIIGAIALLAALIISSIVFGNKIRRFFKLRQMKKTYVKYTQEFDRLLQNTSTIQDIEHLLNHWKSYLQKLEREPYTTLTTKEILTLHSSEEMESALKSIDRTIYSNKNDGIVINEFGALKNYAQGRFELKVEEVKNA